MNGERKILTFSLLFIRDSTTLGKSFRVRDCEYVLCVRLCVYVYVYAHMCAYTYAGERGAGRRDLCQELSTSKKGCPREGFQTLQSTLCFQQALLCQ